MRQKILCITEEIFYGYKLHSVCFAAGVIESLDLTSVHDIHYLKDVQQLLSNCIGTLKIGGGASGITLLKNVRIYYELWRNINGFPPEYYKQGKTSESKEKE